MNSGMEAVELEQLVKLAIGKMNDDFQQVYDPATRINYEKDLALFGGGVDFSGSLSEITSQIGENVHENLQEAGGDILNSMHSTGSGMGCTGSHEECMSAATNSMYLVGEVEGGDWGKNKFAQLYAIRKLKEDQDREKGMNEATKNRRKAGLTNLYQGVSAQIQGFKEVVEGMVEVAKDGVSMAVEMAQNPAKHVEAISNPKATVKKFIREERNHLQTIEDGGRLFAAGTVQQTVPIFEAFGDMYTGGNRSNDFHKMFDRMYEQSESAIRKSDKYGSIQRETERVSDNMVVVDAAVYVAAVVVSAITLEPFLGAAMIAGYQGWKGAYEGGGAGMALGAVSGFANGYLEGTGLSVNLSYSFANGFGAGIDYGIGVDKEAGGFGAQIGASWSEREGFGVSAGYGYFAPGGIWSAKAGVKVTQRGGNTFSANAGFTTNNGMIIGLNAFYNDQTNSYGGGVTLTHAPGGQNPNMVSNSSGNSVTAGFNWTNGQGFGAVGDFQYWNSSWGAAPQSMSDLFGIPGDINPRSNGSSPATPEAARRNLLGDIVNGIGSWASRMWDGAKSLFGETNDDPVVAPNDPLLEPIEPPGYSITIGDSKDDPLNNKQIVNALSKATGLTEDEIQGLSKIQQLFDKDGNIVGQILIGADGKTLRTLVSGHEGTILVYDGKNKLLHSLNAPDNLEQASPEDIVLVPSFLKLLGSSVAKGFVKATLTKGAVSIALNESKPALRLAYEAEVKALAGKVAELEAKGLSVESIAKIMHAERRALGVKYKDLTPPEKLKEIYARNLKEYGDKLGPSIAWLREQKKSSWEDIIKSATRPGGADLNF